MAAATVASMGIFNVLSNPKGLSPQNNVWSYVMVGVGGITFQLTFGQSQDLLYKADNIKGKIAEAMYEAVRKDPDEALKTLINASVKGEASGTSDPNEETAEKLYEAVRANPEKAFKALPTPEPAK